MSLPLALWACSSDTERPLSPSSGLFCLLHDVTSRLFKRGRQEAPATLGQQGLLLLVCPPLPSFALLRSHKSET